MTGRLQEARAEYEATLRICRNLAEANPRVADSQRVLWIAYNDMGTSCLADGDFQGAGQSFEAAKRVLNTMIQGGMLVEESQQNLATVQSHIEQIPSLEAALGKWDVLLQFPEDLLPGLLEFRAIHFCKHKRHSEALQAVAKLRDLANASGGNLYNAACVLCLCASGISEAGTEPNSLEPETRRQELLHEACASLRQAIEIGWTDFASMQSDPDLAPLQDLLEFKALIAANSPPSHSGAK
jgi:tetratricopeptide (TPR) repeat protein